MRTDPHWEEILKGHTCQVRTFSAEGNDAKDQAAELFASDIGYINEGGRLGMHFTVSGCMDCKVKVHIPGRVSVYNAMVTMLVCNLAVYSGPGSARRDWKRFRSKGVWRSFRFRRIIR